MFTQGKIDVHHHVYPPVYTEALRRNGVDPSGWYIPPWTVALDDDICAREGISTAILSCTAPGPGIEQDTQAVANLARACNDYCFNLRASHAVLAEIAHALDNLQADGIILLTS